MRTKKIAIVLAAACIMTGTVRAAQHPQQSPLPDYENADAWLISLPPDSYTVQLATIWDLQHCLSVQSDYKLDSMYCLESSTVPNRFFAVSGAYPSRGAALAAAKAMGANDALINYVPSIIDTRCEMPNPDARYQAYCAGIGNDVEPVVSAQAQVDVQPVVAKPKSTPASNPEHYTDADAWLSSSPPDSYTVQLATIWGLDQCQSVQTEYQLDSMYCLESSTVPNRYFALSGVFPNRAAARDATTAMGARDALINYLPHIVQTRCEMPNTDAHYQVHCAGTQFASTAAIATEELSMELAQAAEPAQLVELAQVPESLKTGESAKLSEATQGGESVQEVQPSQASAAPEPSTDSGEPSLASFNKRVSIDIDSFVINGENPLDRDASYAIVNQFLGADKGIFNMQAAAKALENEFRDLGHNFYGVSFPPQDVSDGSIELLITRYKIGKVSVKGNKHYSDQNIAGSLPQLRSGDSPNSKTMVRSLTLANQNSGKRTKLTLDGGQVADEIDATLTVVDQKPMVLSTWINNTGSDDTGNYRIGANISHRNLFGRDHQGAFTFISSPQDVSELQQYTLNYRIPIYELGGTVNLFAVKSNIDTGVVSEFFDIAGRGEVYGVGYSQVLSKKGEYRHGLGMQVTDKLTDNDTTFMGEQVLVDIRSRPLALTYLASWKNAKGLDLSGSITATHNLSGGGQNNDLAYALSRTGADKNWSKLDLGANLQYKHDEWLYTGSFNYSFSPDRLVTGEQFSIGGSASIRGMEERELRGDQGYRISLQAWAPPITKSLRAILFLDAGHVSTKEPIAGEFDSESVSSLGVMLNWNPSAHINAALSYGYLLDGVDFGEDLATQASRDGDSKAHFNLSYRY